MPWLRQLELAFEQPAKVVATEQTAFVGEALRLPNLQTATDAVALQSKARDLLRAHGATRLARELRVEWDSRLKTTAGRANYREKLISLNLRLFEHPAEIDRTLRHELAHILAQYRAGRRRILAHGNEWRLACRDLGIADEKRCHNLPFPVSECARRYLYQCPNCQREFPRVRPIKRAVACLACCRAYNGGEFDGRFRLIRAHRDLQARCQII